MPGAEEERMTDVSELVVGVLGGTGPQGRGLAYRFGATVGRVVYSFRVLVKPEAAYPYETGHSPTAKVTVVG